MLDEAFEGRARFDWGGMAVVELFSMKGRRFRRSYYSQLQQVTRQLVVVVVVVAVVGVVVVVVGVVVVVVGVVVVVMASLHFHTSAVSAFDSSYLPLPG